ncbi:MAG: fibrobacter succinogenes major paralogous domain-containing protein [Fibrobacter sp.]|nr:fibrobacter succinogenes major paralogous domain-containing protein [Fibrobacter sp.]
MNNEKKYIVANLRKVNAAFSYSLLLIIAFFTACSTPTISSDDSDEKYNREKVKSSSSKEDSDTKESSSSVKSEMMEKMSSSSEKVGPTEAFSSSATAISSSGIMLATPCKTETEDNCEYGELTDDRDGQIYKTVKIGNQWWMAENLNYKTEDSWCGGGIGMTEGDCSVYGNLYTWAKVVGKSEDECGYGHGCDLGSHNVQGVCPDGWHLPDTTEWNAQFDEIGGHDNAGKVLKSQIGWYEGGNGTDGVGFSALPAGDRDYGGEFYEAVGYRAYFWSATQVDDDYAYHMSLSYGSNRGYLSFNHKHYALSVRCIKD